MFQVIWRDENLVWNPAKYGHTHTINIPFSSIWYPNLRLMDPYTTDVVINPNDVLDVTLTPKGYIVFFPYGNFDFVCTIDVEKFPFDEQVFYFNFNTYTIYKYIHHIFNFKIKQFSSSLT